MDYQVVLSHSARADLNLPNYFSASIHLPARLKKPCKIEF